MNPTEARREIQELEGRIKSYQEKRFAAVSNIDYDEAVRCRDEETKLRGKIMFLIAEYL
jgi:excinuclease UvrABC helicase subunit UvrB